MDKRYSFFILNEVITENQEVERLINKFKLTECRVIVRFADELAAIRSSHLSTLIKLWKRIKEEKGKFALWTADKSWEFLTPLVTCKLDKVFPIFEDLDSAIDFIE